MSRRWASHFDRNTISNTICNNRNTTTQYNIRRLATTQPPQYHRRHVDGLHGATLHRCVEAGTGRPLRDLHEGIAHKQTSCIACTGVLVSTALPIALPMLLQTGSYDIVNTILDIDTI